MMQPDLTGLKGLHIPSEPPFFPPAWGWWVVSIAVLIILTGLFFLLHRSFFSAKNYALRELKYLAQAQQNPVLLGREISKLLKRIVLFLFPRNRFSTLSADEWSSFLVNKAPGIFSKEQANFIAFSVFLPDNKVQTLNTKILIRQTRLWIQHIFKGTTDGNQNK